MYLTANVNLWPRPMVLFIEPEGVRRADSDPAQRTAHGRAQRAGRHARAYSARDEREGRSNLCRRGVKFLTASDADLAALRASQPVYAGSNATRRPRPRSADPPMRTSPAPPPSADCSRCAGRPIRGRRRRSTGSIDDDRPPRRSLPAGIPQPTSRPRTMAWRFVLDRGRLCYTQSSEGNSRWTEAPTRSSGRTFAFTVTDYGGEAPTARRRRPARSSLWLEPLPRPAHAHARQGEDLARDLQGQAVAARRRRALSRERSARRDVRGEPGARARRTVDAEPPAERLDAVGEPAQARSPLRIGPADAVVADRDRETMILRARHRG